MYEHSLKFIGDKVISVHDPHKDTAQYEGTFMLADNSRVTGMLTIQHGQGEQYFPDKIYVSINKQVVINEHSEH